MATITPGSLQRRKRAVTYGRRGSPAIFNNNNRQFFDEETRSPSPADFVPVKVKQHEQQSTEIVQTLSSIPSPARKRAKRTVPVQVSPKASTKPIQPKQNTFDVPSSEDELESQYVDRPRPKTLSIESRLFDDRTVKTAATSIAKDKSPGPETPARRSVKFDQSTYRSISMPSHLKQASLDPDARTTLQCLDPASYKVMNAKERLQYRQQQALQSARTTSSAAQSRPSRGATLGWTSDGAVTREVKAVSPAHPVQQRLSPMAISPAYARTKQTHEHNNDHAVTEVETTVSLDMTPKRDTLPSTSSDDELQLTSPRLRQRAAMRHTEGVTPRQNRLWKDLFASTEPVRIQSDTTASRKRSQTSKVLSDTDYATPGTSKKPRLVDRLKAATPKDDASDGERELVINMPGIVEASAHRGQHESQMSQPSNTSSLGSKMTYTQQRSYLAEDNIEDALLLDLAPPVPLTPRKVGRSNVHISDFDMDAGDDDEQTEVTGKLRSVHELRMQGRSARLEAGMEDLMQDITNRKPSARQQSMTALVKLTSELLDVDTIKLFQQYAYEERLITRLHSAKATITQTLLIAATTLLLAHGLSESALRCFQQSLHHINSLSQDETELGELILRPDSSLSASARTSAGVLSEKLRASSLLWSEHKPIKLRVRTLYLRAVDLLVQRLRACGDTTCIIETELLGKLCPADVFLVKQPDITEYALVISLLEALSSASAPRAWPVSVTEAVATLPRALDDRTIFSQQTVFLGYRLLLNVTNNVDLDYSPFESSQTVPILLRSIVRGFVGVGDQLEDDQQRTIQLDLLILGVGIMINLSEYSQAARQAIVREPSASLLDDLVDTFEHKYHHTIDAESVDESSSNVAYGYLSVMLATLCQEDQVRETIRRRMKSGRLLPLFRAVEEFIMHHQRVDKTTFEGDEGRAVWSTFTERLRDILSRLESMM